MNQHKPKEGQTSLINVLKKLKKLIADHCQLNYAKEDYCEFLFLAASAVDLEIKYVIRKPDVVHQEHWTAKAIYLLKMELLYNGIETILKLTALKLKGIKRFNRFVCFYIH